MPALQITVVLKEVVANIANPVLALLTVFVLLSNLWFVCELAARGAVDSATGAVATWVFVTFAQWMLAMPVFAVFLASR